MKPNTRFIIPVKLNIAPFAGEMAASLPKISLPRSKMASKKGNACAAIVVSSSIVVYLVLVIFHFFYHSQSFFEVVPLEAAVSECAADAVFAESRTLDA
jgi:hypothetical protein